MLAHDANTDWAGAEFGGWGKSAFTKGRLEMGEEGNGDEAKTD